jgi:hypothetical protein
MQVPDPTGTVMATHAEYSTGIHFTITSGGTFAIFESRGILALFINAIVLLSLPNTIIYYVALYCVGLISTIYASCQNEILNIPNLIAGYTSRMASYTGAYRHLTKQWDKPHHELMPLNAAATREMAKEVFAPFIKDGTLNDKEIEAISQFMLAKLDVNAKVGENGKAIEMNEYIRSATQDEPVNVRAVASLFDHDRKVPCMERLMNDQPFTPSALGMPDFHIPGCGSEEKPESKDANPVEQPECKPAEQERATQAV